MANQNAMSAFFILFEFGFTAKPKRSPVLHAFLARPEAHEKVFRHIHDLCMTNGVEGRRGVSPRPTGGLEELNYAAGRRVYLEALIFEAVFHAPAAHPWRMKRRWLRAATVRERIRLMTRAALSVYLFSEAA